MFYNAIPIGMILKHASHTLLELLHSYTIAAKQKHAHVIQTIHPTSLPWVAIFDLFHSQDS